MLINAPDPNAPEYDSSLLTATIENGGLRLIYDTTQVGHLDAAVRTTDLAGESALVGA